MLCNIHNVKYVRKKCAKMIMKQKWASDFSGTRWEMFVFF